MTTAKPIPAVSFQTARTGASAKAISAKRTTLSPDEAKDYAARAVRFRRERGRSPAMDAADEWERKLAEGAAAFMRYDREGRYD